MCAVNRVQVTIAIITSFLFFSILIGDNSGCGDEITVYNVEVHVMGAQPQYKTINGTKVPIIVKMAKDIINITLSKCVSNLTVILHAGENIPIVKNETNYYEWKYTSGIWQDVVYGKYIVDELCKVYDSGSAVTYTFGISVGYDANTTKIWSLHVVVYNTDIYKTQVIVDNLKRTIAVSGDILLRGEPYSPGEILKSNDTNTRLRIYNNGNTPGKIEINVSSYPDRFVFLNVPDVILPGQWIDMYVLMVAGNWSPRIIRPEITIKLNTTNYTFAVVGVTLKPSIGYRGKMTIIIGRSGFTVSQENGFVVQYLRYITIGGNETKSIKLYLTGKDKVNIEITGINIEIVSVCHNDKVTKTPIGVQLSENYESILNTTIRPTKGNTKGYLYYYINGTTIKKRYLTEITIVGTVPKNKKESTEVNKELFFILVGIPLAMCASFAAYYTLRQMRHTWGEKR